MPCLAGPEPTGIIQDRAALHPRRIAAPAPAPARPAAPPPSTATGAAACTAAGAAARRVATAMPGSVACAPPGFGRSAVMCAKAVASPGSPMTCCGCRRPGGRPPMPHGGRGSARDDVPRKIKNARSTPCTREFGLLHPFSRRSCEGRSPCLSPPRWRLTWERTWLPASAGMTRRALFSNEGRSTFCSDRVENGGFP